MSRLFIWVSENRVVSGHGSRTADRHAYATPMALRLLRPTSISDVAAEWLDDAALLDADRYRRAYELWKRIK